MRIRLERLRIESDDTPMSTRRALEYWEWYIQHPGEDRDPIEVEECGADCRGRLYEIKNGRHRYVSSMLAGRKDILSVYKGEPWTSSTDTSSSTSGDVQSLQSVS